MSMNSFHARTARPKKSAVRPAVHHHGTRADALLVQRIDEEPEIVRRAEARSRRDFAGQAGGNGAARALADVARGGIHGRTEGIDTACGEWIECVH